MSNTVAMQKHQKLSGQDLLCLGAKMLAVLSLEISG
jgi:hypothetical protein